jgi:hypothetical protein
MSFKSFFTPAFTTAGRTAALGALLAGIVAPAQAGGWYFYVQNSSKSAITRLEVREKGGSWGQFDLDGGIAAGQKVRIDWARSTDNEDCKQSIRAGFADGTSSEPTTFDFCDDLNTPIVFSD